MAPDWNGLFNTVMAGAAVSVGGLVVRRLRRVFSRLHYAERDIEEIRDHLDFPRQWREENQD